MVLGGLGRGQRRDGPTGSERAERDGERESAFERTIHNRDVGRVDLSCGRQPDRRR
jgi:hypothetical protein